MEQPTKITKDEIIRYSEQYGENEAANLLLLGGPDWYNGSYDEYEQLYKELISKNVNGGNYGTVAR